MDVTSFLINFLRYLILLLQKVDISIGDDDWDDFVDLCFDIFVITSFKNRFSFSLDLQYERWPREIFRGNQIRVKVINNTQDILVGQVERNK